MYRDETWVAVAREAADLIIPSLEPIDGRYILSAQTSRIEWHPLAFYEDVVLLRLHEPGWGRPTFNAYYLLERASRAYRLRGVPDTINAFDQEGDLRLSADNVLDYLRFYCFFTVHDGNPFVLLESADDHLLPAGLDDAARARLREHVRPPYIAGTADDGYVCEGFVLHGTAVCFATFLVRQGQPVQMLCDELRFHLPSAIDAPLT